MSKERETLKQALELLAVATYQSPDLQQKRTDVINAGLSVLAEPEQQQEPVANDRVIECAKRLVEHADFKLGGVLSADSKAKDIPSRAVSQVKARHLAALRDALANTSPPASKPWQGLTDEERHACTQSPFSADNYRAIEAKLKEKNNG